MTQPSTDSRTLSISQSAKEIVRYHIELDDNGDIHVCGEGIYGFYHEGDGWTYDELIERDPDYTYHCSIDVGHDGSVHMAWVKEEDPYQDNDVVYYAVKRPQ